MKRDMGAVKFTLTVLLSWPFVTAPIAIVTWFGDHMLKDGPIGAPAYLVPALIGLAASVASSSAVYALIRPNPSLRKPEIEGLVYIGGGILAGLVLLATFCLWWGDWCFGVGRSL
jgi:hypothetical protein